MGREKVKPAPEGMPDLKDATATALTLFSLSNVVAANRMSQPKRIAAAYANLPQAARDAIERRD